MTSRYYINGNTTETTKGSKTTNKDWKGVSYDRGIPSLNGEYYSPDAKTSMAMQWLIPPSAASLVSRLRWTNLLQQDK